MVDGSSMMAEVYGDSEAYAKRAFPARNRFQRQSVIRPVLSVYNGPLQLGPTYMCVHVVTVHRVFAFVTLAACRPSSIHRHLISPVRANEFNERALYEPDGKGGDEGWGEKSRVWNRRTVPNRSPRACQVASPLRRSLPTLTYSTVISAPSSMFISRELNQKISFRMPAHKKLPQRKEGMKRRKVKGCQFRISPSGTLELALLKMNRRLRHNRDFIYYLFMTGQESTVSGWDAPSSWLSFLCGPRERIFFFFLLGRS